jgi:hypothetical protein
MASKIIQLVVDQVIAGVGEHAAAIDIAFARVDVEPGHNERFVTGLQCIREAVRNRDFPAVLDVMKQARPFFIPDFPHLLKNIRTRLFGRPVIMNPFLCTAGATVTRIAAHFVNGSKLQKNFIDRGPSSKRKDSYPLDLLTVQSGFPNCREWKF